MTEEQKRRIEKISKNLDNLELEDLKLILGVGLGLSLRKEKPKPEDKGDGNEYNGI